ncbi:2772_t:CDS:2 [Entrophospora sp. SA101]|nr:2772_t:CDS:2 [Entrophospora sp. SA101]
MAGQERQNQTVQKGYFPVEKWYYLLTMTGLEFIVESREEVGDRWRWIHRTTAENVIVFPGYHDNYIRL